MGIFVSSGQIEQWCPPPPQPKKKKFQSCGNQIEKLVVATELVGRDEEFGIGHNLQLTGIWPEIGQELQIRESKVIRPPKQNFGNLVEKLEVLIERAGQDEDFDETQPSTRWKMNFPAKIWIIDTERTKIDKVKRKKD